MKKKHSISPLKPMKNVRSVFVEVECDSCEDREGLYCYEREIKERRFLNEFYECKGCGKVMCINCLEENPMTDGMCIFCHGGTLVKITPKHIYLCKRCFASKEPETKLCKKCKHVKSKK